MKPLRFGAWLDGMGRARAQGDEGLVPEIGLRLEHRHVRQQPRYAILRCAKLKKPANLAASLQHTFRERETLNADLKRRHENTILHGPDTSEAVLDAWRDRAPEKIRANAVHGLEYFIGASPEAMHAMSRAESSSAAARAASRRGDPATDDEQVTAREQHGDGREHDVVLALDDEGDVAAHGVGEAEDVGGRGVRLGAAAFHDSRSCQTSLPGHSSPRGLGCVVTRLADERIALHRAPRTPSTALHRVPPHRSTCALDEVPWP